MRCPSCHTNNAPDAQACEQCGLLLLPSQIPKRRKDDVENAGRRAEDRETRPCPLCHGPIDLDAVRCRHCSEIVDENYRRQRLIRRRNQINYASWVAYIFGLLLFLVFKPVGLLAIGAGLLMSIIYYAIPVEQLPSDRKMSKRSLGRLLRRQVKFDRVGVPIPHFPKRKLVFVGTPLFAAVLGYLMNFLLLQAPMNRILDGNEAFQGMEVSTHYDYWVVPGVIVYDLTTINEKQSPIEVHAAFLEFAKTMRDHRYRRVKLCYRGDARVTIDGATFRKLGQEYSQQNFTFALFEFPRLVNLKGNEHGRITAEGQEALLEFVRHWYLDEVSRALPQAVTRWSQVRAVLLSPEARPSRVLR